MATFPGFVGAASPAASPNVNTERLINFYPERSDSPAAKTPNALYPAPGFSLFATLPESPVRGAYSQNDRAFAVGGTKLFELMRDGTITPRPMTAVAVPAVPVITVSDRVPALVAPSRPGVQTVGAVGSTTYGYKVTALSTVPVGETEASLEGILTTGAATLDATNYNGVTWDQVPGATGYKVYGRKGAGAWRLLGTSTDGTAIFFADMGDAGTPTTPPTANTTGDPEGATHYGYKIAATNALGSTPASAEGVTAIGHATLSARLYTIVTWTKVPGSTGYLVYRTTGGTSPPVLVATITSGSTLSVHDTGQGVAGTPPTVDTTLGSGLMMNDGAPVIISSSGDAGRQVLLISGGHGYVFDLDSNLFSQAVVGATQGGYLDGFFVVLDAGTSTLRVSGLLDGLHWDPAVVTQRIAGADRWLAMSINHREIWIFGSQTTEVWYNAGTSPFPFAPLPGVFVEKGIVAPFSVASIDGAPIWLGQDIQGSGTVWRANGYTPERVSSFALESALSQYTMLADAEAWTAQVDGHQTYVLTFPTENKTWVLDLSTGAWHERGCWNPKTNSFDLYRPRCHAFAFSGLSTGTHLVGDRTTGGIYRMSSAFGNDITGDPIRRVRRCPHLSSEGKRLIIRRLQIDLEVGLGLSVGQGSDPTLMVRMSGDGGKTWSSERWRSAGRQGEYRTRAEWRNWGAPRDCVFEFVCADPIPWRIAQAFIDVEAGAS